MRPFFGYILFDDCRVVRLVNQQFVNNSVDKISISRDTHIDNNFVCTN